MRKLIIFLIAIFSASPSFAQGTFANCVSPKEMGEIVAANKFVAPTTAVITARKKVPNADVVRADLCKQENSFIYVIVALNKEGRAMHVLVSPESGKVTATK